MKIIVSDSLEDRNTLKDLLKPHMRFNAHLGILLKGLRQNSKLLVQDSLRVMCVDILECYGNFCTFKFGNFECHMEQVGHDTEVDITLV